MKALATKGARLLAVLPLLVLFAGTSTFAQVPVSLPDLDTTPGETVTAPVEVGDVSGEDIQAFEFTVTYDPSLVEVTASPSGLSASDNVAEFRANNPSEGELRVAVTSGADAPLDGSGSLAELEVTAASDVAGTTDLTFESFQFNEGTPSATRSGGSVEVKDVFISLPDIVAQSGDEVEIDIETSDLTEVAPESYQFELPYDPSVLSSVEVVQEGTLSEGIDLQSTIDQDGGSVTVAAAAGTDPLEGSGTLLTIQGTLSSGSTPLEFSSFQFEEGRISAGTSAGSVSVADVIASFPEFPAVVGTSQSFSVRTTDLAAGMDVLSYQFTFEFDPDVLDVTGIETEGTLSEGASNSQIQVNGNSATVAVASDSPLEGSGSLIEIQADVVGAGESPLEFREDSFQFNEGDPTVTTRDGLVTATAESSSAQFIHNAADPGASPVDIYFGDAKVLDDFEFRAATPFLDVPADTEFEVGVAPGSSSGPGDIIASFPNSFASDSSYTVVANGVLSPGDFADNPDGEDTGFELFVETGAEQTAADGQVGLRAVHGATDAPTVDIDENGTTLFDNVTYGDVSPDYLEVAAEMKRLIVTPGESEEGVAAFQADLSGLGGSAATVLASGFLDPAANQDGPGFALIVALPNGDVRTLPSPTGEAQFIHNAADPAAETVDVYLDGELAVDDFSFRSATPFVEVPAAVGVDVGVAPGDSEGPGDIITSQTVTFNSDEAHTVVANGVINPDDFADNPDGESIAFEFFAEPGADSTAADGQVGLRAVHGATDAPTVDIDENGTTLFDNVTYGDVSPDYLEVAAEMKRLLVTPGESEEAVAAFRADLSGLGGSAATVLASGFLDPSANQDGPGFALVAVLPDGSVVVFEALAPIDFDVTRDFSDASVQANYELVALPGDVDIDLVDGAGSGFSGEQGPNWRAFRELGAANGADAELQAYDGSDAFNFREGRAFWVISQNQFSVQGTTLPTLVSAIDLQGGWNAISNPLRSGLDWSSLQNANGLDQALFRWNGGWEQVDSLGSARTGEGYYVFNSAELDSLSLTEEADGNALAANENDSKTVGLTVRAGEEKGSSITAGVGSEASTHRAPPTHFSSPKTTLRILGTDSDNRYVRMVRPVDGESTTFSLALSGKENESATLEASGLGPEGPEGAVLVEEATGQSHDLRETSTVTVQTGDDGEARLTLHVGSSEVNDIVAPDETELRGNYPNPFSQKTTIELALSEKTDVEVRVYNVLGQQVATVADGEMTPGTHKLDWDGDSLSSGIYFVRMETGSKTDVHKITVVQ